MYGHRLRDRPLLRRLGAPLQSAEHDVHGDLLHPISLNGLVTIIMSLLVVVLSLLSAVRWGGDVWPTSGQMDG